MHRKSQVGEKTLSSDTISIRRYPSRSRSFIRRAPLETWARSSSVIAKLKTLRGSPKDIDVAVEVLKGYVDAKRRKGRNDGDMIKRLEAIKAATPPDLYDAFLFARHQCGLPLPASFTGCIHRYARSRTLRRESVMSVQTVTNPDGTRGVRLSNVFSPRRGCLPEHGIPSFLITAPVEDGVPGDFTGSGPVPRLQVSYEKTTTSTYKPLSLDDTGFLPFVIDLPEETRVDPDPFIHVDGLTLDGQDQWDMDTLDDFPLPPTHVPSPAPTPPRRTMARVASASSASTAASSPSAWSIDSCSSDDMPITPGSGSVASVWGWSDDDGGRSGHGFEFDEEDDDSRTITGVTISSDGTGWASRKAMDLDADDVFLVGMSTAQVARREYADFTSRRNTKDGDIFGLAI